jgi:hypothetical protein
VDEWTNEIDENRGDARCSFDDVDVEYPTVFVNQYHQLASICWRWLSKSIATTRETVPISRNTNRMRVTVVDVENERASMKFANSQWHRSVVMLISQLMTDCRQGIEMKPKVW